VKFIEFLKMAVGSLLVNKLRSALTMLGMIIGVSAVIILMSVGAGLQNMIVSTFEELGTNLLFVQPANPEAPGLASLSPGYATPKVDVRGAVFRDGKILMVREKLDDGWTIVTKDRRLSAHFEHTVVVREEKAEILTK